MKNLHIVLGNSPTTFQNFDCEVFPCLFDVWKIVTYLHVLKYVLDGSGYIFTCNIDTFQF